MISYPVLITHTADGFAVAFIDFPECQVIADQLDAALDEAADALEQQVDALLAQPDAVLPDATELASAIERARMVGAAAYLVPLPPGKGRAIRVNITIDEHLLAEIDAAAIRQGTNRSAYLAAAARHALEGDPEGRRNRGYRRGRRSGHGARRRRNDRRSYRKSRSAPRGERSHRPAG